MIHKRFFYYPLAAGLLLLGACVPEKRELLKPPKPPQEEAVTTAESAGGSASDGAGKEASKATPANSMVMIHATNHGYHYRQPWNKKKPGYSTGFAIYLGDGRFLTNAGVVVNASFLELLSPDGSKTAMASLETADYEMNLAILKVEGDAADVFVEGLIPIELADDLTLGSALEIWQFNDEGLPIVSQGVLESTELNVPMSSNVAFVLYKIRAAVNAQTAGATMPVMADGKLVGISLSNENSENTVLALPRHLVKGFLDRAAGDGEYKGVPVFGIQTSELLDPVFRKYLKLPERNGGVYVVKVVPFSSADQAGIKKGDVLEYINGLHVDGRGIVQDDKLGPVSCSMYLHDLTRIGDEIEVGIRRDGEQMTIKVTMNRDGLDKALIGGGFETSQPKYVVYGGLLFQPLTRSLISEIYGDDPNKMSMEILEIFDIEEQLRDEGRNEVILLTSVLPTTATHGYATYGNAMIKRVNGDIPRDLGHLSQILDACEGQEIIEIETNKAPYVIYFSGEEAQKANEYIRKVAFRQLRNL